ncbi:MAG: linear amide C-N hydrolase [Candidatus Zixiibacteriota bacterium]|nr:MAG: linear amide C-N hydrolase [candidate division Zixibacteria bacterium]
MQKARRVLRIITILAILLSIGWHQGLTCSTFILKSEAELVFGGNLDFYTSRGLVIVNKRGVAKSAFLAPPETPVSWASKYGSITFNQVGREFPFGGLNEKGLVIQMMWLEATDYPPVDDRPAIQALQWIQYQLDNFATVSEVLESESKLRISAPQATAKLHYLIGDAGGKAATIEFIGGKPVYHTGESLPVVALANSAYGDCLRFHDSLSLEERTGCVSYSSGDRFVRIAKAIDDFNSGNNISGVKHAFDILESVKAPRRGSHCTAWSVVYDVKNMRLFFKTFENPEVRIIEFDNFDFSCASPVMVLDMNTDLTGSSDEFIEYTPAVNEELVSKVMTAYKESGFLSEVTDEAIQLLAHYPDYLKCR